MPRNTVTGTISSPAPSFSPPSSANITTGNIRISAPDGNVFLTNQQFQNTTLVEGTITTGAIDTSSTIGNGGAVTIDSKSAINVDFGQINTQGVAKFNNGNTRVLVTFSQANLLDGGIDSDVFFLDLPTARQGNILAPNDDESTDLVSLGFEFPFFGTTYTSVYVNNNGNVTRQQPFSIVHMATHADISSGKIDNSYIQLWNDRLRLNQIRQLELNNPQVEMLVLSACRTALGNEDAELGFAGLAVNAGVKTTVASLWFVNDTATAAFMTQFYRY